MASIQKKVEWTEEAKEDYREMVSFLYDTWSEEHADRFAEAVEAMTQLLTTMPEYGTPSRKFSAIRRVLIRPYTALHYVITRDAVVVFNLRDTRREDTGLF